MSGIPPWTSEWKFLILRLVLQSDKGNLILINNNLPSLGSRLLLLLLNLSAFICIHIHKIGQ